MNYTDKEIQIATQISYINIDAEYISKYYRDYHDYPTLAEVLRDNPKILEEFYKMFYLGYNPAEANGKFDYISTKALNEERERIAKSDIEALMNNELSCSNWKVVDVWDKNKEIGIYGILFETPDNKAVIAFRGSEILRDDNGGQLYLDWIDADCGLLDSTETRQQEQARLFLNYMLYYRRSRQ